MNDNQQLEQFDRILLEEDAPLPSSGFAMSVMDAIQERATEPAPIPFPWKLALPGFAALIVAVVVLIWFAVAAFHTMNQSMNIASSLPRWYLDLLLSPSLRTAAAPALLALAGSAACALFCRKLTGGWSTPQRRIL